ncbi:hypothetical protein GCM10023231_06180 [Olivibacter ginsenosidimutans]|uniref:Uncharacterized protein n=1 Tax=Olivibacter ginsenosidimutans TaxID=1176537 RepID=A0ABP9AJY6_9SPHI
MPKSFKPINQLEKLFLKISNRKAYKKYKREFLEYKTVKDREATLNSFRSEYGVLNLDAIITIAKKQGSLNFSHAGNAGDIIYALPTIKEIQKHIEQPINLYLILDQPHSLALHYTHPLGSVMLNRKMANMLVPLLSNVEYLTSSAIYEGQRVDITLDSFRELGLQLEKGSIVRWYSYATGVHPDLSSAWLSVRADTTYKSYIVLARSERYRNPHISYSFLKKHKNILFLGIESEYKDILQVIPHIKWKQVEDFKEMAEIIAGCKFFIGNQSFPYSVAEALRVPRILEVCYEAPNVIPEGENGFDFYLQEHFEWLVTKLDGENQ